MSTDPGDMCDCCAGTGTPASGPPCICGGTGRGTDEKVGLRQEVHRLRAANATLIATVTLMRESARLRVKELDKVLDQLEST